ncbi:internalin, putative [Minicystis rosea]|nr:internalin, putative [Minicystis rosea]
MKRLVALTLSLAVVGSSAPAFADTFASGSLIIPMDTTYQDSGMLKAYGLVYQLLKSGVPVRWVIKSGKSLGEADFTASSKDNKTNAAVTNHGYRGGPFVIDGADAAAATPIITAWQTANTKVVVHVTTASFSGDVARYLVVAPRVAMHADGSQNIAVGYLNAAGITDSTGNAWSNNSPDLLTPEEVAGPTTTNHHDGALFDADGDPVYCQFMSMHWGVTSAQATPEVVAETRDFLTHPTHFFAECQAVNAFENLVPYGRFLTPNGFNIKNQPNAVDTYHADQTFMQIDGAFGTVGGSEPAYALPTGDTYKSGADITMLTNHLATPGSWDVWMTGYLDGACPPTAESCGMYGKVSYLGGHQYTTNVPISTNPKSQGVRLFLNSLFDSYCAAVGGVPYVALYKTAPATTLSSTVTYSIDYANYGPSVALDGVLTDPIPAGSTFVSATGGGTFAGGNVTWKLGNLGVAESGSVQVTVTLGGFGSYTNTAQLGYKVGLNPFSVTSNTTATLYDKDTDGDGILDAVDTCPNDKNPGQNLLTDPQSCGTCGNVCGMSACINGSCAISSCPTGFSDCNGVVSDGCEYANGGFAGDPQNCGGCGLACSLPNADASCVSAKCAIAGCQTGFVDLDGDAANGCEYTCTKTAPDDVTCNGVDDDCDGQIDEDYAPVTCGVGACAATSTCKLGVESCSPGSPSAEGPAGSPTCSNGIDDDCNGSADSVDPACQKQPCKADADCDDDNACTTDACSNGFCSHAGVECGSGGGGGTSSSTGTGNGGSDATGGGGGSDGGASPGDQGSCSCRTTAPPADPTRALGLVLAMAALAARRRKV